MSRLSYGAIVLTPQSPARRFRARLLRVNLVSPKRAHELRMYLAARAVVLRAVQMATPSYTVTFDEAGEVLDVAVDWAPCAACELVRLGFCELVSLAFWGGCPLHREAREARTGRG